MTGDALGTGQPKIGQLQLARFADEQVLRLHVPVQHPSLMAIGKPSQQLEQEQAHVSVVESARVSLHVL